jgi:hypothetical protein
LCNRNVCMSASEERNRRHVVLVSLVGPLDLKLQDTLHCHSTMRSCLGSLSLGLIMYGVRDPALKTELLHLPYRAMADPFSVAGTTVGITSLRIQTCQILYNYCSKFKSHGADIDNVLKQVQALQNTLENLREVKTRFKTNDYEPSSQLQQSLKACQEALKDLKAMADKCNTTQQIGTIKAGFKNVKKRVLWPLKKETLVELKTTLSSAQHHLSLILQIAGLDIVSQKIDGIHPALNTLYQQGWSAIGDLTRKCGLFQSGFWTTVPMLRGFTRSFLLHPRTFLLDVQFGLRNSRHHHSKHLTVSAIY